MLSIPEARTGGQQVDLCPRPRHGPAPRGGEGAQVDHTGLAGSSIEDLRLDAVASGFTGAFDPETTITSKPAQVRSAMLL